MIKSSAYLTHRTRCRVMEVVVEPNRSVSNVSKPSSAIFAIVGEAIPPCGVPAEVGKSFPESTYPALSQPESTALSIGMWRSSQECPK